MEEFTFKNVPMATANARRLIVSSVPLRGPALVKSAVVVPGYHVYEAPAGSKL